MTDNSAITESFRFVDGWIKALSKSDPGNMSVDEHLYVVKLIRQCQPCDMLVFGAGKDSLLWRLTNPDGRLIILESSASLAGKIASEYKILNNCIRYVRYSTTIEQDARCTDVNKLLLPDMPTGDWQIIIVDAPRGTKPQDPGRMQSIYNACVLAINSIVDTHVLVHDCDREIEAFHCDWWFEDDELVTDVGTLRHYLCHAKALR